MKWVFAKNVIKKCNGKNLKVCDWKLNKGKLIFSFVVDGRLLRVEEKRRRKAFSFNYGYLRLLNARVKNA